MIQEEREERHKGGKVGSIIRQAAPVAISTEDPMLAAFRCMEGEN